MRRASRRELNRPFALGSPTQIHTWFLGVAVVFPSRISQRDVWCRRAHPPARACTCACDVGQGQILYTTSQQHSLLTLLSMKIGWLRKEMLCWILGAKRSLVDGLTTVSDKYLQARTSALNLTTSSHKIKRPLLPFQRFPSCVAQMVHAKNTSSPPFGSLLTDAF